MYGLTTALSGGQYSFSLDTRGFSDGWHSIGVRAYDPDGESAFQSVSVLLDNTAPKLGTVTVLYSAGRTACKVGDFVSVTAISDDPGGSGLSSVWINASNLGAGNVQMLDDGLHNDSSSMDGVFGSGGIKVDTTMGYHFAFITATDKAGNMATAAAKVAVDTHEPLITTSYTIYPVGQTAAKLGDAVRIVSKVVDTKMTVDTVLVMDTSGSMAGTPISDAKTAAKTFIGNLGEFDRAAIYSFNSPAGSGGNKPKQEVTFTSNKATLNSTIDGLTADDWTPLYDTIYDAIQYAKTSPNMPVVIVLTDGNDDLGSGSHSAHPLQDCKNASIPVYTIGLDPGSFYPPVNETVLKEIAQTSDGGSYYHAPTSSQLKAIYEDIASIVEKMDVGGISRVYCDASPIGGPSYVEMFDDGTHNDLAVGDGYYGSDYITVGSSATANVQVTTTAEDVAGNKDTDVAVVRLDNTLPTLASLQPRYSAGRWWAQDGDSISFTAQVADTGDVNGLRHVELDASVIGGPAAVDMVDDGTGNDITANDGTYTSAGVTVATGTATRFFTFKVTAWDNASNSATQSGNVYIDNGRPLDLSITAPAAGQYVEGLLTARVQATDRPAIERIELTLLPPNTIHQTSFNALTGYYEYLFDTANLPDGSYFLTASGRDIAGRQIPRPVMVPFFIDNHAPLLKLNTPRNGDYLAGTVNIDTTGTNDTFLLSVEYNVDTVGWVPVNVSWDTTGTPDGQHTLTVRATDRAGHYNQQVLTVIVDNTNPTCRIIAPGDGDLLEGKLTVRIKASDTVGVSKVLLTGVITAEAEYNPASGYFEYDLDTRELADGNYSIGASAGDDYGHQTSAAAVAFTVDNNVPTLTVLQPQAYDYVSGVQEIRLISGDGPFTDKLTVDYKVDERSWVGLVGDNGTWTVLWDTTALSDGAHTLQGRSTDIIGNVAQQTIQLTVDNHSPACRIYSPLPGQYVEGRQLFQVLAQDEVGIVNVTIDISGVGTYLMSYNGYTGYYEFSMMTTGLPDGKYNLTVSALDRSGKTSAAGPMPFNIDNVPPSFTLVSPREGDAITDNITVVVAWTGGRAVPGEATVRYRIDTGAWIPAQVSTSADTLGDGSHSITVRAEDPAGHSTEVSVHIFIDRSIPELTVLSPKKNTHVHDTVALKLKARDGAGIAHVTLSLGNETLEELYLNGATGFYESELDLSGEPDGSYSYCVTASDLAGHQTVANVTVLLDTSGPELVIKSPSAGGDKQGRIKFTVQATDASNVAHVSISLKSGDWRQMSKDASGNYVYSWDTTVNDDGTHTVEIMATDKLGNEADSILEVSVKNRTPNFLNDNFNWLLLLVLILGFVGVGATVAWTGRRQRYHVQAQMAEYRPAQAPRVPEPAPPTVPEAAVEPPPPVPPPTPLPASTDRTALRSRSAGDEVTFEEDEELFEEAPPARQVAPAPAARSGFSLFGKKKQAPAPRGATGASIAAAVGPAAGATVGDTGFEEVAEDEPVEELKMDEKAWMPRDSLPPAAEMPRPLAGTRLPTPAPTPGTRPPAPGPVVAWGRPATSPDMWEDEEETTFEEEPAAPSPRPPVPGTPPAQPPKPAGGGITPLDALVFSQLKVTRTDEERKMRGPPPGWSHPRPAELQKPAPPPPGPAKPKAGDELYISPSATAVKPVPPEAQKLSKKDREKMGAMLDDLLTKSRKK